MSSSPRIRLLFVGRPTLDKGLQDLLRALDTLPHAWSLSVVGEIPAALVRHPLLLSANTTLHGRVTNPHVAKLMTQHDIVIVPSRYETFGNVALEAMAAGCIVVASRTGGLVNLVREHVTGYLFEPGDIADLTSTLSYVITNLGDARSVAAAAAAAASEFDWEAIVTKTATVFASLARSRTKTC